MASKRGWMHIASHHPRKAAYKLTVWKYFHTDAPKLSHRPWNMIPTVSQRMRELLGPKPRKGVVEGIQESVQQKYPNAPPEQQQKLTRLEVKNMMKEQIKNEIKARMEKDRADYYARQPKNEEERIMARIKKAEKIIAHQRLQLRKYLKVQEETEVVQCHDPEVLTAEQLHYLKKMGQKHKNYCPVGKRGVYGGTVENMHMHWKRHETVRVDCHTFSMEETRKIAEELARLSGGIVVDIFWDKTIIMYRGRNYEQPTKLIPDGTLNKRSAYWKSLLENSINNRLNFIEGLRQNLQQLREQREYQSKKMVEEQNRERAVSPLVKKTRPLFRDVGETFEFEEDSDPCSETDSAEDEGDGGAEEAFSGEEDQRSLVDVEGSKDFHHIAVNRRLWNHRRIFTPEVKHFKNHERFQRRQRPKR